MKSDDVHLRITLVGLRWPAIGRKYRAHGRGGFGVFGPTLVEVRLHSRVVVNGFYFPDAVLPDEFVLVGSDFPAGKLAIQAEHAQLLRACACRAAVRGDGDHRTEIQMIEEFSRAKRRLFVKHDESTNDVSRPT